MTGECKPLERNDASSAVRRRDDADKSNLRGKVGLCKEEMDIAEGRRPGRLELARTGGESVGAGAEISLMGVSVGEV